MIRVHYTNDENTPVAFNMHGAMIEGFNSAGGMLYVAFKRTATSAKPGELINWSWQRPIASITNFTEVQTYLTALITSSTMGLLPGTRPAKNKHGKNSPDQNTNPTLF